METELEYLAVVVHGAAAVLNGLGVIYNARRRSWFDTTMNSVGLVFHAVAVYKHYEHYKEEKENE